MRLICLPYAGGTAFAFQPLSKYYPKTWQVSTLAYPGRGSRIMDPLVFTMEELVEDCWQQIKGNLQAPYVFFGHSLGSTIAYLLTHRAKEEEAPPPLHLFLSGTDGPSLPAKQPYRYLYPKTQFKLKLESYGGIPAEILNDEAAFDFFEPILRADFQVVETWQYHPRPKLAIPATIITGTEEDMTDRETQQWQKEFSTTLSFRKMKGNHFFLFKQAKEFVHLLEQELRF